MEAKEVLMVVGERIRAVRKRAKLTQTELGQQIGYSMNGIAKIERGESDPKLSALVKIARVFDMELWELIATEKLEELDQRIADNYQTLAKSQQALGELRDSLDEFQRWVVEHEQSHQEN